MADTPKEVLCVCGKPIWGEGWNPETGQMYYSHKDDGEEQHEDGSWVRPAEGNE